MTSEDNKKHHTYGGSTCKRWMTCTASVKLIASDREAGIIPKESKSSPAALEGTRAHNLAEACLLNGYEVEDFFMQEFEGATINENYVNAVKTYVNYCRPLQKSIFTVMHWVEGQFDLKKFVKAEAGGSADFLVVYGAGGKLTMEVVDYKHGSGIVVEVENNFQARFYALAAYTFLKDNEPEIAAKIEKIKYTIVQPRVSHIDGPIRSEEITLKELIEFGRKVKKTIRTSERGKGVLEAGEHCTFCPRAGYCEKLANKNMELAQIDFQEIKPQFPVVSSLTKDQIEYILKNKKQIESWLKSVYEYATNAADKGEEFNNYKLVKRFGNRKYSKTERSIVRKLRKLGYDSSVYLTEPVLKSPAQLEQALAIHMKNAEAKEFVNSVTEKPDLGVSLAELTDGRESALTTAESDFADLTKKVRKRR